MDSKILRPNPSPPHPPHMGGDFHKDRSFPAMNLPKNRSFVSPPKTQIDLPGGFDPDRTHEFGSVGVGDIPDLGHSDNVNDVFFLFFFSWLT